MFKKILLMVMVFVLIGVAAQAFVPEKILFQGVLTDKDTGQPPAALAATDVQYSFNNSNFAAVDALGFGYDSTTGFLNAFFGVDPETGEPLQPDLFEARQVWIKIKDGDVMGPQELASAPYALRAGMADMPWVVNPSEPAGNEIYYMNLEGKVAIGKQDPAYRLDVLGDINYSGTLYQNGTPVTLGGGGGQWQDVSGGIAYNAGKVGVGTTVPEAKLSVLLSYPSGTTPPYLLKLDTSAVVGTISPIKTQLVVTGDGKVGIGTTTPTSKLSVNGPARIQNYSWPTTGKGMELAYRPDFNRGFIQVQDRDTGAWGQLYLGSGRVGIGTTNPQAKLHIGGTVGVDGIMFPDGTLQTTAAGGGGGAWTVSTGGDVYRTSGNVGIGTTSPSFKLDVHGSAADVARIGQAEIGGWPSNSSYAYFGNEALDQSVSGNYSLLQGRSGATYLNAAAGQKINFRIKNITKMVLDSAGNVGIGTSIPQVKLSINGPARIENYNWALSGKGMEMQYNPSINKGYIQVYDRKAKQWGQLYLGGGNVGIGTTAPSEKLEVKGGNLKVTSADGNKSFRLRTTGDALDFDATGALLYLNVDKQLYVNGENKDGFIAKFANNATGSTGNDGIHIRVNGDDNVVYEPGMQWPLTVPLKAVRFIEFNYGPSDGRVVGSIKGNSDGGIAYVTSGGDYAEYFGSEDDIMAGQLVGLNCLTGKVRHWQAGDPLVGVVSTSPGFIGNEDFSGLSGKTVLVALLGQVRIKDQDNVTIAGRVVKTTDGQKIGYLLANGRVLLNKN